MDTTHIVLGLLVCAIGLGLLARRMALPYPVVLVLGGLVLGFVPNLPTVKLDPDFALAFILPPILYHAAIFTSWRDFRANLRAIGLLAIGLVIATTVAIAVVARYLVPDMPWSAAFVLGAIVSPPDAVAATAILNRLRIPRRIVAVLEGESLVNDATGLVIYKFAIAAVLTGAFSLAEAGGSFVVVGVGGIAVGLAMGWIFIRVHRYVREFMFEISVSLVLPFVTYLAAESVNVSGVLAVVAAGLLRGWHAPEIFSAETRLQAHAVWSVIIFLLNSLVFILIGIELSDALDRLTDYSFRELALYATAVGATAILVRFAWVFPATYLPRLLSRHLREIDPAAPWQHIVIVSWAGMRGIVSLAAALALPYLTRDGAAFPARDLIIFLSFAVIFVTLVLQGTTLGPLIRWLGVGADSSEEEEERQARIKTAYAAVAELDQLVANGTYEAKVIGPVRAEYRSRIVDCDVGKAVRAGDDAGGATAARRAIRLQVVAAERRRLIKLRRDRLIGDEVLHRIQRELDLEELRLS